MKTTQRLTRAGIVLLMVGTTASLLPEDGSALATQDKCNNVTYTFGESSSDKSSSDTLNGNSAIDLGTYDGNSLDSNGTITVSGSNPGFAVTGAGTDHVSIRQGTSASGATITFVASFTDNPGFHPTFKITN